MDIDKNTPEKRFRASPVTATIWANEAAGKDGEVNMYRTITLERSYKDKDDKWQSTHSLRTNDLPKAILVLQKAYEHISLKEGDNAIGEE
jgi:hypothetical protein